MFNSPFFGAEIIIGVGYGIRNRENFEKYVVPLAQFIHYYITPKVAIGGTRKVVEKGILDAKYKIGQTGENVSPKIYIAMGISGAIQHMVGVRNAKNIIAVNTDPNARIFQGECDLKVVAPLEVAVTYLAEGIMKKYEAQKDFSFCRKIISAF